MLHDLSIVGASLAGLFVMFRIGRQIDLMRRSTETKKEWNQYWRSIPGRTRPQDN